MSRDRLVTLGRVVRPHGLRGEFRIHCFADSPFLFDDLRDVFLQQEGERPQRFKVRSWRTHKQWLLLTLESIEGLDQAEPWRGASLLARYRDLEMGSSEDIFYEDLLGRAVRLADGSTLGRIVRVQDHAGQELWSIEDDKGREILFPAAEQFIVELHKHGTEVVIDPPPGLIELYLGEDPGHTEPL
jgi:16S rRNA processing protein RimM